MQSTQKKIWGLVFAVGFSFGLPTLVRGQGLVNDQAAARVVLEGKTDKKSTDARSVAERSAKNSSKVDSDSAERLNLLEGALREQGAQLERLQKLVQEQQQKIQLLTSELSTSKDAPKYSENAIASPA